MIARRRLGLVPGLLDDHLGPDELDHDIEDRALAIRGSLVALERRVIERRDLDGADVPPGELRRARGIGAQAPALVLDPRGAALLGAIAASASRRRARRAPVARPAPGRAARACGPPPRGAHAAGRARARARASSAAGRCRGGARTSRRRPSRSRRPTASAGPCARRSRTPTRWRAAQARRGLGLGEAEPEQRAGSVRELGQRRLDAELRAVLAHGRALEPFEGHAASILGTMRGLSLALTIAGVAVIAAPVAAHASGAGVLAVAPRDDRPAVAAAMAEAIAGGRATRVVVDALAAARAAAAAGCRPDRGDGPLSPRARADRRGLAGLPQRPARVRDLAPRCRAHRRRERWLALPGMAALYADASLRLGAVLGTARPLDRGARRDRAGAGARSGSADQPARVLSRGGRGRRRGARAAAAEPPGAHHE